MIAAAMGLLLSLYGYHHLNEKRRLHSVNKRILGDYIRKTRAMKFKDDKIRQNLLQHGYNAKEVDAALRSAKK